MDRENPGVSYDRASLVTSAADGDFVGTFTARLGANVDLDHPQPGLWTLSPYHLQRGRQQFPTLNAGETTLRISGRHVMDGARIHVDGRRVTGNVRCEQGALPDCTNEVILVQLAVPPAESGMHFLQVQNPDGLLSNDFIFHTTAPGGGTVNYDLSGPWFNASQSGHGWFIEQIPGGAPDEPDFLNAYWYVYRGGEPVWLTGLGPLVDGRAELQTFITSGGDFPPDFDADLIDLEPWGSLTFEFADDRIGSVVWASDREGFGRGALNIQRLGEIDASAQACLSGSYYNLDQPGHGFVAQVLDVQGVTEVLLSWYVYRDGKQLWLLGQAPLANRQAEVDMQQFSGADFPPRFASSQVTSNLWGRVSLRFNGNGRASVAWEPNLAAFQAGTLELIRLTTLSERECR